MIRILNQGINPILNQYDYPEVGVRIGIDIGESAIIQYGWDISKFDDKSDKIKKEAHYDILGYTINIATKMTSFAKSNGFIIGQYVYEALDQKEKAKFVRLNVDVSSWSFLDEKTGDTYAIYAET